VIEAYEQKRWPLGKDPNVPVERLDTSPLSRPLAVERHHLGVLGERPLQLLGGWNSVDPAPLQPAAVEDGVLSDVESGVKSGVEVAVVSSAVYGMSAVLLTRKPRAGARFFPSFRGRKDARKETMVVAGLRFDADATFSLCSRWKLEASSRELNGFGVRK
jgi:hypothetical protein